MKALQKLLALVFLITFCVPSLSLPVKAETTMDFMQDAMEVKFDSTTEISALGGRYEAMEALPDGGTKAIVFDSTSSGREMRYQMQYLPANGQYHMSFWYKTVAADTSSIAYLDISYCGSGKNKSMGYKKLTVKLPQTAGAWKQFDLVFENTDITTGSEGTLYMTKADGTLLLDGSNNMVPYSGIYISLFSSRALTENEDVYYTIPTLRLMSDDITGKYNTVQYFEDEAAFKKSDCTDVHYTVSDSYGSREALYTVLGIRGDSGTQKTVARNVKLSSVLDSVSLSSDKLLSPVSGTGNLLKYSDMENIPTDLGITDEMTWVPQGGTKEWGEFAWIDTSVKHGGNTSVRVQANSTKTSPFIKQVVQVDALTKYQMRVWTRHIGQTPGSKEIGAKFEFYGTDGYLRMSETSSTFAGNAYVWTQFEQTFTTPPGATSVTIQLRVGGSGEVWFDDVEFYKVEETPAGQLKTDQVFYYPSAKTGSATLSVNRTDFAEFDTAAVYVDYALKYGSTTLAESKNVAFCEDTASFVFDAGKILETKVGEMPKEHIVEAKIYSGGELFQILETAVYKYKRPDCIDENGNYYTVDKETKERKIFIPVIGYHVGEESALPDSTYQSLLDGGINVVQISYGYAEKFRTNPDLLTDVLDKLDSYGMKGIVCLYGNMVWASHPRNIENTKAVVSALSGHNAVFGWAVQDEPASQIPDYENNMIDCYKLVKQYDTSRPVYICDTLMGYELRNSLYCDMYLDSTYPATGDQPGNETFGEALLMDTSAGARLANKPFYHLVKSYQTAENAYFPDITDIRSMLYSSLLSGARGIGYYTVANSKYIDSKADNRKAIFELPEIWDNGLVAMVDGGEHTLMFDLLAYGDYPEFSAEITDEKQYKVVLKDDDIYAVILNGAANGTSTATTVSIPAKSYNGKATLYGGTAEALYGCSDTDVTLTADSLSVDLPANGVAVIKISGTGITAESLAENKFTDLTSYVQASEQIEALGRMGRPNRIINYDGANFMPDKAITRGDLAYFLINTLQLRFISKETEYTTQFADVNADSYYAEAVQIGRRLGIFRGDDDGNFNPETPITRQEMMTVVARGMLIRYKLDTGKTVDLDTFSDAASVADWARSATAVLLGNGIVKGQADNKLNPGGYATRAEVAVMMARIAGVSSDVFDIRDTESYKKDLYILSDEELAVCAEILSSTDNIQADTIWSQKLEKNGTTYVLVQNLKDESAEIKVQGCAGQGIEILCGGHPDVASFSRSNSYFKMTLAANTTALVKVLPAITQGFYNDNNVKYGYLCSGSTVYAKKFEAYPVYVALYSQTGNEPRELLDIFTFSASNTSEALHIPEGDGVTYSVKAFSQKWVNTLKPSGTAYGLQSE
ncbi:MAG: hypothetical protein E7390_06565 [Ruminococcaceae bacterium]|nr:hypothetical protein [Oscillospiraceae bacterium]